MFAFQEDATDAAPASKQEMLENEWKASAAPWQTFRLAVPLSTLKGLGPRKYIRSGTLASNLDLKTYDVGQLVVATLGMADTSNVGELYVDYEVELFTPVLSASLLARISSRSITSSSALDTSVFGTTPTLNTSGLDVSATVNTITFNRVGNYLVESTIVGTGLFTAFVPVVSASTANTALALSGISNAAANAGTAATCSFYVVITTRGQTFVLDCDTQATTISSSLTRIATYF
jgi:hypothetical protein